MDAPKENRPQIVHAHDINQNLKYNQYKSEESITKRFSRKRKTILDLPLSEVIDQTLNFVAYADDDYSESLNHMKDRLGESNTNGIGRVKLYYLAFLDFCKRSNNLIYLGIWLVFFSIIIYFLNITIFQ